jgi:hypothetical protein
MSNFAAAQAAILQLHARYIDAVWRKDHEAVGECLTEDCEWRIAGQVIRGRAAAVEFAKKSHTNSNALLVTLRTPCLEVGGGTATGRTYFSAQNFLKDGTAYAPLGIYYERFVEQGDRWLIAWRLFQSLYVGPPDMSGKLIEHPDFGRPPAMPALDALPAIKGTFWQRD